MNKTELKEQLQCLDSDPSWIVLVQLQKKIQVDFMENAHLSVHSYEEVLQNYFENSGSKVKKIMGFSSFGLVQTLSACYLKVNHENKEIEIKIKINMLNSIPLIGVGLSSFIMALHQPTQYAPINSVVWKTLFKKEKKSFSIGDYVKYMQKIRQLCEELQCEVFALVYLLSKKS